MSSGYSILNIVNREYTVFSKACGTFTKFYHVQITKKASMNSKE
jgi:hypothetical protein